MDIKSVNALDRAAFVARFGAIFEHSPWIAERAWTWRPFINVAGLHAAMVAAMRSAARDEQLALLRTHPELAGHEAQESRLTAASESEQASAGLIAGNTEAEESKMPQASELGGGDPGIDALSAAINKLAAKDRRRGYVTEAEVSELLPPDRFSCDGIEEALSRMSELGIEIIEAEGSEPEKPARAPANSDRITAEEFRRLERLNADYRAKFGFPFIIAVRTRTKHEILAEFERRLMRDAESEFSTALGEIETITRLRLERLFEADR